MVILMRAGRVAALALAVFVGLGTAVASAQSDQKTLRFIPQADLRSIDPIWTTAYVTRNFGYLVFDTLFATRQGLRSLSRRWSTPGKSATTS